MSRKDDFFNALTPENFSAYLAKVADGDCRYCGGNDKNTPCAYPSEGKKGCIRDKRLKSQGVSK